MALFNAETVVLNTEESVEFMNELIQPDSDYIAKRNAIFNATDERMSISECEDGFVVDTTNNTLNNYSWCCGNCNQCPPEKKRCCDSDYERD